MATWYGKNATLRDNTNPRVPIPGQEERGRLRLAYDEFDLALSTTGGVQQIATNEKSEMCEIPAGARVVDAILTFDALTTAVVDVGWEVSADAVEAAVSQGFFAALDVHTAANSKAAKDNLVSSAIPTGIDKVFASKVRTFIKWTTAPTAIVGKARLKIYYVLD